MKILSKGDKHNATKKYICTILVCIVAMTCYGCQSEVETEVLSISNLALTPSYQLISYDGNTKIQSGEHSFLTINRMKAINEDEHILYNVTVYDVNDVMHYRFENVEIYAQNSENSNVSCKILPGGYFTLELKSDVKGNIESKDFLIELQLH